MPRLAQSLLPRLADEPELKAAMAAMGQRAVRVNWPFWYLLIKGFKSIETRVDFEDPIATLAICEPGEVVAVQCMAEPFPPGPKNAAKQKEMLKGIQAICKRRGITLPSKAIDTRGEPDWMAVMHNTP